MSVRYDFTGCKDWPTLFFGLTLEQCEAEGINPDEWTEAETSPWFRVKPGDSPLHDHWHEQGCIIIAQHAFVHSMMMALIVCMPAPGWGLSSKNIDEAVRRLLIYQELVGPMGSDFVGKPKEGEDRKSYWQSRHATEEEIRQLEGLSVNFSTVNITTFRKTIEQAVDDKVKSRLWREKEAKKQEAVPA